MHLELRKSRVDARLIQHFPELEELWFEPLGLETDELQSLKHLTKLKALKPVSASLAAVPNLEQFVPYHALRDSTDEAVEGITHLKSTSSRENFSRIAH